jgi:hypothetical protein
MWKPLLGGTAIILLFFSWVGHAYDLPSLKSPIPVISDLLISAKEAEQGGDFHATLAEPINYQGLSLPDGTQFIGHLGDIQKSHQGKRLRHLSIWIDQAVFPNGSRYTIYRESQLQPNLKLNLKEVVDRPGSRIEAGERLYLQFTPADMKGFFETSLTDHTQVNPLE